MLFHYAGGMWTEMKQLYRALSQLLCENSDISYSDAGASD